MYTHIYFFNDFFSKIDSFYKSVMRYVIIYNNNLRRRKIKKNIYIFKESPLIKIHICYFVIQFLCKLKRKEQQKNIAI